MHLLTNKIKHDKAPAMMSGGEEVTIMFKSFDRHMVTSEIVLTLCSDRYSVPELLDMADGYIDKRTARKSITTPETGIT